MIAARWAMLVVAALAILVAFGTTSVEVTASSLRLSVTAVFGVLAPLFWPGCGSTPARTALRVVAWSAGVAASAAISIDVLAHAAQPVLRIVGASVMLLALLLLSHTVVAVLERRWRVLPGDAVRARELAGRVVALALAVLGTLPFWVGPIAEVLTPRLPGVIDAVVGASPLVHLAVASNNDLLRNAWLYGHSNLSALSVSFPEPGTLAWCYGSACLALALVGLASRYPRRAAGGVEPALK